MNGQSSDSSEQCNSLPFPLHIFPAPPTPTTKTTPHILTGQCEYLGGRGGGQASLQQAIGRVFLVQNGLTLGYADNNCHCCLHLYVLKNEFIPQNMQSMTVYIFLENEFFFLDLDLKLSKVAPDGWKEDTKKRGKSAISFSLYFRIKFFVDDVSLIQ